MSIHIQEKDTQSLGYVLHLEPVLYFEGSMGWESANFCTSTLEEYLELLGKIQGQDLSGFTEVNMPGRLLIISTPRLNTKLIAHYAALFDFDVWYAQYRKSP